MHKCFFLRFFFLFYLMSLNTIVDMLGSNPTFYRFYVDRIDMSALRQSFESCLLYYVLIFSFDFVCMGFCVNAQIINYVYLDVYITEVLFLIVKLGLILFFMVIRMYQVIVILFLFSNERRQS